MFIILKTENTCNTSIFRKRGEKIVLDGKNETLAQNSKVLLPRYV